MTRSRSLAAVVAAGAVVAVVLAPASPAAASVAPAISVDSPSANEILADGVTISGNASMPGSLDNMGTVRVSLTSSVGAAVPAPCDPCSDGNGQSVSFSWSPDLPRNGPYVAHVSAGGSQFLLGVLDGEATSDATVPFRMEVKPADPAGVRAEANPDQTVRVTWARNGEPDMIAYRVQRKDPGASTFHDVVGAVAQPSGGSAVSVADPVPVSGGGTVVYQVQAIRAGRSGDASTAVGSAFSTTEVVVAAPVVAGAPGAPPAGPPENAAPTPNLSAFLSGGAALPKASLPDTPSIPDGGFNENLPFAIPPANSGRAGDDALGIGAGSSGNGTRAILIPIAGGFLLCLVAFHVRRFNGWLAAAPGARARPRTPISPPPAAQGRFGGPTFKPPPAPAPDPTPTAPAPAPAASWLLTATATQPKPPPKPLEAAPGVRILGDAPPKPTSLESWLKPSSHKAPVADDGDNDDDAKWAALTPAPSPEPPAKPRWDDILVKPGAGTTRRS